MEETERRYDKIVLLLVILGIAVILGVIAETLWWQIRTQSYRHTLSEQIERPDMDLQSLSIKWKSDACSISDIDQVDQYADQYGFVREFLNQIRDFPVTTLITGSEPEIRYRFDEDGSYDPDKDTRTYENEDTQYWSMTLNFRDREQTSYASVTLYARYEEGDLLFLDYDRNRDGTGLKGGMKCKYDLGPYIEQFARTYKGEWSFGVKAKDEDGKPEKLNIATIRYFFGKASVTWKELEDYGIKPMQTTRFDLTEGWTLLVSASLGGFGEQLTDQPAVLQLVSQKDGSLHMDIRNEGIEEFYRKYVE